MMVSAYSALKAFGEISVTSAVVETVRNVVRATENAGYVTMASLVGTAIQFVQIHVTAPVKNTLGDAWDVMWGSLVDIVINVATVR